MAIKSRQRNGKLSRAAFIRSQPRTMPVAEVVKLGRAAGYEITDDAVKKARYVANAERRVQSKAKPAAKKKWNGKYRIKAPKTLGSLKAKSRDDEGFEWDDEDVETSVDKLVTERLIWGIKNFVLMIVREEFDRVFAQAARRRAERKPVTRETAN